MQNFNFNQFKAHAEKVTPFTFTVSLSQIELLDNNKIAFPFEGDKMLFNLSEGAVGDLIKLLDMPSKVVKEINSTMGPQMRTRLLTFVQQTKMVGGKAPEWTFIINRLTPNTIESIVTKSLLVSPTAYFNTLEGLIDDANAKITDSFVSPDGTISLSASFSKGEFGIKGLKDEFFHPGFTLKLSPTEGLGINSFIERLVCENGMQKADGTNYRLIDFKNPAQFFEIINNTKKNNFIPEKFVEKVQLANNTYASFAEVKYAAGLILKTTKKKMEKEMIDAYVPLNRVTEAFKRKGVDPIKWNDQQAKTAITNAKVWDIINGVTWFGSHDEGYNVSTQARVGLQIAAGNMFAGTYDTQNLVGVSLVD